MSHLNKGLIGFSIMLILLLFSCAKNTNTVQKGTEESFVTGKTGGEYFLFQGAVGFNIPGNSIDSKKKISVEIIDGSVYDRTVQMISSFQFNPSGLVFNKPV